MLDGLRRGHGHEQRTRVGVADVLGGEHDHPAGDEARVLAALEHRGQVVDGRVRVGAAHRLDERRDEVVVRVAALVVDERPLARCILDLLLVHGRVPRPGGLRRELEDVQRVARVAAGPLAPPARRPRRGPRPPSASAPRAHDRAQLFLAERLQLVDLDAREQGGVDLEVRVLGRRADQRHEALLDRRQERVLLRLVEAVDLVEEEDRPLPRPAEPLARPAITSRTSFTVAETAESSSKSAPVCSATIRASVVLPVPGGP